MNTPTQQCPETIPIEIPAKNPSNRILHKIVGRLTVTLLCLTLFSGYLFYYVLGAYGCVDPKYDAYSQIDIIRGYIVKYKIKNHHFPHKLDDLINSPIKYLDAKTIPLDPWKHPFYYECPGTRNTDTFDLFSAGPDGKPNTKDDIISGVINNR